MHEFSKAYIKSIQLKRQLEKEGYFKKIKSESLSTLSYDSETMDETTIHTKGDYAYVDTKTFTGLSKRAIVMVSKIMIELKANNTLWEFDQTKNARESAVITKLRAKNILFKTDKTNIHYVNPFLIRKGMIGNIIFRMINLLENSTSVTTDHIKKLPWKGKVKIKPMDYVTIE